MQEKLFSDEWISKHSRDLFSPWFYWFFTILISQLLSVYLVFCGILVIHFLLGQHFAPASLLITIYVIRFCGYFPYNSTICRFIVLHISFSLIPPKFTVPIFLAKSLLFYLRFIRYCRCHSSSWSISSFIILCWASSPSPSYTTRWINVLTLWTLYILMLSHSERLSKYLLQSLYLRLCRRYVKMILSSPSVNIGNESSPSFKFCYMFPNCRKNLLPFFIFCFVFLLFTLIVIKRTALLKNHLMYHRSKLVDCCFVILSLVQVVQPKCLKLPSESLYI